MSDEVVDHPYRKPGVPRARILHERVLVFFNKREWDAVVKAAGSPSLVESWVYAVVMEALDYPVESAMPKIDVEELKTARSMEKNR